MLNPNWEQSKQKVKDNQFDISIPRNTRSAYAIVQLWHHNSLAWDSPMGEIIIDLKDFVTTSIPNVTREMDLKPIRGNSDKMVPTG